MNYNLEGITEMIGSLTALNGTGDINGVYLEISVDSARKLSDALRTGRVTAKNQNLFFSSISLPKDKLELFIKGQTGWISTPTGYAMTAEPQHAIRFRGNLQTAVKASNGYDYAFDVQLGGIEFDIGGKNPDVNDEFATFDNVKAIIYPVGSYKASIRDK